MKASATAFVLALGMIGGGLAVGSVRTTVPMQENATISVPAEQLGQPRQQLRAEERDLKAWALERFALAGLELPPVSITIHATKVPCGGNTGISVRGGSVARVELCPERDAPDVVAKRAILHELAHVWAATALTDDQKQAFSSQRGCAAWGEGSWENRGSEHAAEIIAWALMDRDLIVVMIPDHELEQLVAAYHLLTGSEPVLRLP